MSESTRPSDIGVCLSGGGARAMAFHLGCMKALSEAGLLERVTAISAVSGGSVLAGLYCSRIETFDEFERRVVAILRRGILREIAGAYLSIHALAAGAAFITAGAAATITGLIRTAISLLPIGWRVKAAILRRLSSPVPRWTSRTDALERALRSPRLLGAALMKDLPRARPALVVNAADLRTQTAFRFAASGAGSWRHGRIIDHEIALSEAVAASAAFPILLPAIERRFTFEREGQRRSETVLLTDGGIYDNLGLKALHPTRPDRYAFGNQKVPYIIACVAEPGLPSGLAIPRFLFGRLLASFSTAHRQLHASEYADLHDWKAMGAIRGFLLPYLGQDDTKLPAGDGERVEPLGDLADYPVDFSPMPEDAIRGLVDRGRSLTHRLLQSYGADINPPPPGQDLRTPHAHH